MQKLKLASLNDRPCRVMPFLDKASHALHINLIDRKNKKFLEELKLPNLVTNKDSKAANASN